MNKQGGFTDLFILIIFAFTIALITGIFLYIGGMATDKMHEQLDDMEFGGDVNSSKVVDATIGRVNESYQALKWIGVFLFFGMIIGIFIGSYLVTTKPIFFVPYIFVVIIAVILSVVVANAYETLINTPLLASSYGEMVGINWFILRLPIIISIVGIIGGIIMFSRVGRREELYYG